MRFFKYRNTKKNLNAALKEQYKTLNEDQKRTVRKEKAWRKFAVYVTHIILLACYVAGGICLIKSIPQPAGQLLKVLVTIGKVIAGFILLFVSGLLTYWLTQPLWKKVESFHLPTINPKLLSKACAHLRDYYGLNEPYIITKCFDSTNKRFKNHDVCIFIANDELRITTDLIHGFLHGERDLGCYAFGRGEIILSKQQVGGHLIAELKADNITFSLGYRAKGFIEKNFIAKLAEQRPCKSVQLSLRNQK